MILILLVYNLLSSHPQTNIEQVACDYFFEKLAVNNYQDLKSIEFEHQTDTLYYWGGVFNCSQWEDETKKEIISTKPFESIRLETSSSQFKIKKIKKNSNRLKVFVYSKIKVGNQYFVQIQAYRNWRFVDYSVFEFDNTGKIINLCKTGEII